MLRWQKLTDARGEKGKACDLREILRVSGMTREDILLPGYTASFWLGFVLAGVIFILLWKLMAVIVFPLLDIPLFSVSGLAAYSFIFVFPGVVLGIETARFGWRSPQYAIDAMMRVGLCPSCGYRVVEIEPDPDGCTVCPECGAAWRFDNNV